MPDPIAERIADNLVDSLNVVKIDGGYSVNLTAVRRSRIGETPAHGLCVIHQVGQTLLDNPAHLIQLWKMDLILLIYVIQSEKADEPIDRQVNLIVADVCRALMADPQRGGLAQDTSIESVSVLLEDSDGYSGFEINISIGFQTREDDPTLVVS